MLGDGAQDGTNHFKSGLPGKGSVTYPAMRSPPPFWPRKRDKLQREQMKIQVFEVSQAEAMGMGPLSPWPGEQEPGKFIVLNIIRGRDWIPSRWSERGLRWIAGGFDQAWDMERMKERHVRSCGSPWPPCSRLRLQLPSICRHHAGDRKFRRKSYKPGDMLKPLSGQTVEADQYGCGRKTVLSDGLTYSLRYQPRRSLTSPH